MKREFVYTPTFDRSWKDASLDDSDLQRLEQILLKDPHAGDVIPGLSGARKLRFSFEGKGKSGSARVIYVDVLIKNRIYCLLAYSKGEQDNLTKEQEKILSKLVITLKKM